MREEEYSSDNRQQSTHKHARSSRAEIGPTLDAVRQRLIRKIRNLNGSAFGQCVPRFRIEACGIFKLLTLRRAEAIHRLADHVQKTAPILVILEDSFAPIATRGHVIDWEGASQGNDEERQKTRPDPRREGGNVNS